MTERPSRHVCDPPPEQTVVERRDAEGPVQEQVPEVHEGRGTDPDCGGCHDH